MFIANFFFGLIVMAIGVLMLKYNYQISNMFNVDMFSRVLGSGGTFLIMQLVAILVLLFGFLLAFSLHDDILGWLFSPLDNLFR
jgi:hypothetical protein